MRKIFSFAVLLIVLFEIYSIFFALDKIPSIKYVDRKTNTVKVENVLAEKGLKWLYYDPLGKLSLNALIKRKFLSEYYGRKMDSPASVKKIEPLITKLHLKEKVKPQVYHSFNEFFTREIPNLQKRINFDSTVVVSPACGKVLGFQNAKDMKEFVIKGIGFSLKEFVKKDCDWLKDAAVLIIRLTPADYHRFYFPYDCKVASSYSINGFLYSVSPLALKKFAKIFLQNKRQITVCENRNSGKFIMAEVGATFIGSIVQTYKSKTVKKGDEKGYFKFGGSSIVLIFHKDKIKIDSDIIKNTQRGLETSIFAGEKLADINLVPKKIVDPNQD